MLMRGAGLGMGAMMGGTAVLCGLAMAAGFGLGAATVAGALVAREAMRRRMGEGTASEAGRYDAHLPGEDVPGMGVPAI